MKRSIYIILILLATIAVLLTIAPATAGENVSYQKYEYATIRWAGRANTQFIRPNGKVEMLGEVFSKIPLPKKADERAFYMTIAMNVAAKQGFEYAGAISDGIIMRRGVSQEQ